MVGPTNGAVGPTDGAVGPTDGADPAFEALLILLRDQRGFDFTGYKRTSLMRRVNRRMQQVNVSSFAEYVDLLQVSPSEYTALFNTLLINVTSFFRDAAAWEKLQSELLPELLQSGDEHRPIRIWSAGCASGEEAYTLAMVLAEVLGAEAVRERVKIYATDIDEEALTQGRQAVYTDRDVADLPAGYLERYFEQQGQRYTFAKELRRSVIFGRNDLVQDAPISHVDLLTCRNTLMYLNAETQAMVLQRLHFALNDGGLLLLGKAEMLLAHGDLFSPVDLGRRFFRRITRRLPRDRSGLTVGTPTQFGADGGADLQDLALRNAPTPQIVVGADGKLVISNERAESLFGLLPRDVGRPFQDLELSYRPVELRSLVEQATAQRRTTWAHDVSWVRSGEQLLFNVEVLPLTVNGKVSGTSILFHDVTRYRRLQSELERSNRQLETAYEELQSTNEELETTNEELQSTVEELETTNEELQSTNEELETMNEELQSTNDEFQTINDELRERSEELAAVNAFTQSILTSLRRGVIVVDRDLRVIVWNQPAEEMWGIRQDEAVGAHLISLDIGLPVARLRPSLRAVLAGQGDQTESIDAIDRRGRPMSVRVAVTPLDGADRISGAVLLLEPVQPVAEAVEQASG